MHKAKPSRGYNIGQYDVSEFIADFVEELDNEYEDSYTGISDLIRTDIAEQLVCDKCNNATTNYLHVMVHALLVHEATLLEAWNTGCKMQLWKTDKDKNTKGCLKAKNIGSELQQI